MSDLKERLEAARTRAAEARKVVKEANPELAEVEKAEREAARLEAIALGQSKFGQLGVDFGVLVTNRGAVVVERPSPGEYDRYHDLGPERMTQSEEVAKFASRHVRAPELPTFDKWADALPSLRLSVVNMALRLAETGVEAVEGK
jgi:hypothetical protein